MLVVYSLDRLSRDPIDGFILKKELEEHNVNLEIITESVNSSELGKLISYVGDFTTKVEAEKIRKQAVPETKSIMRKEINKILDMFDDAGILDELRGLTMWGQ